MSGLVVCADLLGSSLVSPERAAGMLKVMTGTVAGMLREPNRIRFGPSARSKSPSRHVTGLVVRS